MKRIPTTSMRRFIPVMTLTGTALAVAFALLLILSWSAASPARADESTPSKPAGLSVSTQPGSLDVSLDWRDTAGATSYLVRWREGGAGNRLNEGSEVQSSDADITVSDYGKWVVRVEACNDAGCGPGNSKSFTVKSAPEPTPEPTAEPTPAPTRPDQPTGLSVSTQAGLLKVSVDWDDVTGADSYKVLWRPAGLSNSLNKSVKSKSSEIDITVADYGIWLVSVEACNDAGCGPGNSRGFIVKPAPEPTPEPTAEPTPEPTAEPTPEPARPVRPTGLSVSTQPGSLDVSLDWRDTAGATSYLVRWREGGAGNRLNEGSEVQSSDADITVSDYGKWVVRVEACNDAGCGPGNSKSFTVKSAPEPTPEPTAEPTPEAKTPHQPQTLTARQPTRKAVTLTWTAPADDGGSPITGYKIVREKFVGPSWVANTLAADTASTSTSYVDDTVEGETTYYYYVRAINKAGVGDDASTAIVTVLKTEGVPRAPRNLRVTEPTRGEVRLTWTAPAGDGGSPITGYKIVREHREGTSKVVNTLAADTASTSTSYVDGTVEEETEYYYYVRAINKAGVGDEVFEIITTKLQVVGVPGKPSNLSMSEATRGEVTLTWNAPADNGGSSITGYNIVRAVGSQRVTIAEDTASTSTSYVGWHRG